ncbi:Hypothetical protein HDN1F_30480 [gamma proteobacterium HdN1]|nr:Hypothetical protein HDN1F_30480 [gamma proteobacterium HdN1]
MLSAGKPTHRRSECGTVRNRWPKAQFFAKTTHGEQVKNCITHKSARTDCGKTRCAEARFSFFAHDFCS